MFERFLMPLEKQLDDGLGMAGEAFMSAAKKLTEDFEGKLSVPNGHLPVNYLYRHSIELFLKSSIVIVHRALALASGDGPHKPDPSIRINDKWRPLTSTHSLKTLLTELERLLVVNKERVSMLTPMKWNVPEELKDWIATIEAADEKSTYFRYPRSTTPVEDGKKSSFQTMTQAQALSDAQSRIADSKKGGAYLAIVDDADEVVEVFGIQDAPLAEIRDALQKASEMMSGTSFGLYSELLNEGGNRFSDILAEIQAERAAKPEQKQEE